MLLVSRGKHLTLVNVINAEGFNHLGLDEMADAGLGHHGDRHRRLDRHNQGRIAHPGNAALGANIGGHPFEGHHRNGPGLLGDTGLLRCDHIHDHAAL